MSKDEEIINKVAQSGLVTIDLEEYYEPGERVVLDIKDKLFRGIILREKDFRVLFQQGVKENIFTELIEEQWMLVVMFDKRTHIGLVKVLAKRATDELGILLQRVRQQSRRHESVISTSFRTSVEDTIDLLYRYGVTIHEHS